MATWLVIEGMLINATNEQLNAEPLLTKGSWLWEVKGFQTENYYYLFNSYDLRMSSMQLRVVL